MLAVTDSDVNLLFVILLVLGIIALFLFILGRR
jgi:hypothetical protein